MMCRAAPMRRAKLGERNGGVSARPSTLGYSMEVSARLEVFAT